MREIKFRAWDWGKMVQPDYIDSSWDACMSYLYEDAPCEEDYPVMQYIGLKDKNWKEIYEGDIVDFWGALHKIVFNRGCFYMEDSTESDAVSWILDIKYHEMSEVKGNIYENPNLLNND